MADFAPVPPPGELEETRNLLIGLFPPLHENVTPPLNQKYRYITYHLAVNARQNHCCSYMYKNFCKIWRRGFWDMRADRQTNIQTYWYADNNASHACQGGSNSSSSSLVVVWYGCYLIFYFNPQERSECRVSLLVKFRLISLKRSRDISLWRLNKLKGGSHRHVEFRLEWYCASYSGPLNVAQISLRYSVVYFCKAALNHFGVCII